MSDDLELEPTLRELARFFYVLKEPLRLRILIALSRAGEMTVSELVEAVHVSQPLVSWHLGRLRAAGLVNVEREGRIARYSTNFDVIAGRWGEFRSLFTNGLIDGL